MQSRGLSLVEMIVVTSIVSILLAIATLGFNELSRRYRSEAQTRLLFSEILKARNNAICQRRATRVKLYPGRFEVYSSQADDSRGAGPLQTQDLSFPITCSDDSWNRAKGYSIDFGRDGIALQKISVCLEEGQGTGSVDSIKISATRVSIGKKDRGNDCKGDNITIR